MDDTDFSDSSYPMPIANVGRRKRLFNPMSNAMDEIDTSTPDDENYAKYLANAPNRDNYKLGTKDKIINALMSGMAGFTGGPRLAMETAARNKDAPYNEAVSDWKLRGAGMEKLAEIEGRRINTQMSIAAGRNNFNRGIAELEQEKDQAETADHNADLTRTQQGEHWAAQESETAKFHQGELGARAAQTSAFKARTDMMGKRPSRGSQVSHQISMLNQQKAHDESVQEILMEQPNFAQYFDTDPKSGLIVGLKKDPNTGQVVKMAPKGTWTGGTELASQPLTQADRIALQNFQTKLTEKMKKKLSLAMGNIEEMQPDEFDFQDEGPDNLGGQDESELDPLGRQQS